MPFYYRPSRTVFPRRNLGAGSPDQDKNKWEHTSAQTLYYCTQFLFAILNIQQAKELLLCILLRDSDW